MNVGTEGGYRPYPEYRDSGVEWLGEVPAHWEVKRLRFAANVNPSKAQIGSIPRDALVSFLPMERVGSDGSLDLSLTASLESVWQGFTYFGEGDLILAKITPSFENGKGAIATGLTNGIGFGTTELHVIRPTEALHRTFLFYLLASDAFRSLGTTEMMGVAGQQRVPDSFVRNFQFGLPPYPEQRAIAGFLDRQTAAIDALIAKKEQLIALLREKRAALITQAVTKGLDEEEQSYTDIVPLSPWLMVLKPRWERERLKFNTYMKGRLGWQNLRSDEYTLDGPLLISSEHFAEDRVNWAQANHVSEDRYQMAPEIQLREHDVLFMKDGAAMGKLAYVKDMPDLACANSHLLVMRPAPRRMLPRFLYYVLKSSIFEAFMIDRRTGTTFFGISQANIGDYPVSFPSIQDQEQIVAIVDAETTRVDLAVTRVYEAIATVREYRAALISAAVTGKIDVRDRASLGTSSATT